MAFAGIACSAPVDFTPDEILPQHLAQPSVPSSFSLSQDEPPLLLTEDPFKAFEAPANAKVPTSDNSLTAAPSGP